MVMNVDKCLVSDGILSSKPIAPSINRVWCSLEQLPKWQEFFKQVEDLSDNKK